MILLSHISYPSSFTYLSRKADIKHPSYNRHTYIINNYCSIRIPVSQRNYSGFSSYTSLLNQLANKLLDKKARLIIKKSTCIGGIDAGKTKAVCELEHIDKVQAIYIAKSKVGITKIVKFVLTDEID